MFQLENVLGITVNSNGALASNTKSDLIAYPAGSTVILSNVTNYEQHHIINRSKKAVKSLDFTPCGKYLIFTEHGQNSAIKIWNVQRDIKQIGEIHPNDNGTRCFAISPWHDHLVTFGYDLSLSLWDWKKKTKISASKISAEIKAISFSQNGKYFVTVGNKHVKYWYPEDSNLIGKSAVLSDLADVSFCDVACGKGRCGEYTYVATKTGALCLFTAERLLQKCVILEVGINCLVISGNVVFVGCNESAISCFDTLTLEHLFNVPKSHCLGAKVYGEAPVQDALYADTVAMAFCESNNALISIYNDHSLYIWNIQNEGGPITKSHSFLYHSNCIWDLKLYASENEEADSFLTCSSDNTVRSWTIGNLNPDKTICIDNNCNYLKDIPRDKNDLYYGIRCLSISSDRIDVSCGDRKGKIKIYKLQSMQFHLEIQEHNLEVLCLDYTPPNCNRNLLASAGKGKDICIFDVNENYTAIQKIKDHTNSVTTVKFTISKDGVLKLISSSNDGSCIVRSSKAKGSGSIYFVTDYNISLKATLYNVELDVDAKFIFMACQNLKIFDMESRQVAKSLKSQSKGSFVFKIALDVSKKYIATSCLDKSIVVYDFQSRNHLTTVYSNLVTSLCFTRDCKRLIAVTGDGCIFIWKIVSEIHSMLNTDESLPTWAKKTPAKTADIVVSTKSILPRGKWANRMENTISIKSSYISEESDASLQTPDTPLTPYFGGNSIKLDKKFFSHETESSTDVSLEFGAQTLATHPIKPPRRRLTRSSNSKDTSSHSSSIESLDTNNQKENKEKFNEKKADDTKSNKSSQKEINLVKHEVNLDKAKALNVDSKIPIAVRRPSIDSEKREKATLMIGNIKEKLEGISQRNHLKSSTSMFDLSQQPPKGSWLLTYRTSFEGQKKHMRKQGSLGDLTKSKYYSNEQINQFGVDVKNRTPSKLPKASAPDKKQIIGKVTGKPPPAKRIPTKSNLTPPRNEPRLKLSLAKPHLLSRTDTDPQIILRRKMKNESNLASMDKHLSASNNELNSADSFHDLNMSTVKITEQICERAGAELIDAATKAVKLYSKFLDANTDGSTNLNVVENLALSLVWAQIKLQRLNTGDN